MNPLLKTPPGSRSKCSSSIACSMREPILVTLETSSSASSFFSRALRNLSPNSPTLVRRGDDGNIIGQAAWGCHCQEFYTWVTKVAAVRSLYRSQGQRSARDPFDFAQGRLFPPPEVRLRSG